MTNFNQEEGFHDLCQVWVFPGEDRRFKKFAKKRANERKWAKELYLRHILTQELANELLEEAREVMEESKDYPSTFLGRLISDFCQETPVAPPRPPVVSTPDTAAPQELEKGSLDDIFTAIFNSWPNNPNYRNYAKSARVLWRRSIEKFGLAETLSVCRYYISHCNDLTNKVASPLTMHVFLRPDNDFDIVEDWLHKMRNEPSESIKKHFERLYDTYPDFNHKAIKSKENLLLWLRAIPEPQRIPFFFSVLAYRQRVKNKTQEESKYNIGFANFLLDWEPYKDLGAGLMGRHFGAKLYAVLVLAGLDPEVEHGRGGKYGEWVCSNISFLISKKGYDINRAVAETAERRGLDSDLTKDFISKISVDSV